MNTPHPIRWEKAYGGIAAKANEFIHSQLPNGKDATFLEFRRHIMRKVPQQGISSMDILFAIWKGVQVYIIEEGIGDLLLNTSLGAVDLKHFNLPYDAIYVDLPPNDFTVSYSMPGYVQTARLEGIYVMQDPITVLDLETIRARVGGMEGIDGVPLRPITFIPVSGIIKESSIPNDDCLFTFPMFFKEGCLRSQVEARMDEFVVRAVNRGADEKDFEALKMNLESFKGAFEWLINIVLYITMPKARVDGGKGNLGIPFKKLVPKPARKSASGTRVFVVGRGIKISPLDACEPGAPKGGTVGAMKRAHWVRGHYRVVPYGPKDTEPRPTRLKWILPFPRGKGKDYIKNMYRVTV